MKLPTGAVVKQAQLAQGFGGRRGPVREAVRRLQGIHAVSREPYLKARVISFSGAQVLELFQMREALEGLACRLAAERMDPNDSTALAKEIAEDLQREHPKLVTATMTKAKRSGKVFLDWSQNAGSKTTLSPYSLRGRERPTVATPVTWEEVAAGEGDPGGLAQCR